MAAQLHILGQNRLIDSNGIADGASIYFFLTGTTTPAAVYTTSALTTEHTHPITVSAGAAVPDIYLDNTVTYRRRIVYADGNVDDVDPYVPLNGTASFNLTWNSAGTVYEGITLDVTDTASQLTSNLIRLETTGSTTTEFKVTKRGHIYSNSTTPILQIGDPDTQGMSGNITAAGADIIIRGVTVGGGHTVFDGVYIGGTIDAPLPATDTTQIVAFAARSWNGTGLDTVADITWGASQNHSAGAMGTTAAFWITLNDTAALWAAWRIQGDFFGRMLHYGAVHNTTVIDIDDVNWIGFLSSPTTQNNAAPDTQDDVIHFRASDVALGTNSTVLRQTAFRADDITNAQDLNIGFRGLLATLTDYNLYMDGAAPNYLEGSLYIGKTTGTAKLDVEGTITSDSRITGLVLRTTNYLEVENYLNFGATSDGIARIGNWANTDFNRLQFGGTTAAFPSLKRSSTVLQARLADDSGFAPLQGQLRTDTNYTAGAPTATGYLVLYDAAGTAYKVPAEAV